MYQPYAPPQQQYHPAPYGPRAIYKPLGWLTPAASGSIAILVVIDLVASAGSMSLGGKPEDLDVAGSLFLVGAGLLTIAAYLLAVIFFLVWLHRAAVNVRAFGQEGMKFTPGWCVGWWFIPFMNLVRPLQVVQEVWRASEPESVGGRTDWLSKPAAPMLGLWWGAYIAMSICDRISSKVDDLHTSGMIGLVGGVFSTIAAILIIQIMRRLAVRQEACAERTSSNAQGAYFHP